MKFRKYKESDIPQIIEVWEIHSGWGKLTERQFRQWFVDAPYGEVEIIVAEENNTILGLIMFTPCRINCNGTELKGARISAPVIHGNHRVAKYSPNHPVLKLYTTGMENLKAEGFDIVYAYPVRGFLTALKALQFVTGFSWKTETFSCCSVKTKSFKTPNKYTINKVLSFSKEYDILFNRIISTNKSFCGVSRTGEWLGYKLGDFINYEIRSKFDKELLGYISLRPSDNLMVDFLSLNEETGIILIQYLLNSLHESNNSEKELMLMKTNTLKSILSNFNLNSVEYKFGFGYSMLNKRINTDSWYNMPLD